MGAQVVALFRQELQSEGNEGRRPFTSQEYVAETILCKGITDLCQMGLNEFI